MIECNVGRMGSSIDSGLPDYHRSAFPPDATTAIPPKTWRRLQAVPTVLTSCLPTVGGRGTPGDQR
jgi:hypothetical protein